MLPAQVVSGTSMSGSFGGEVVDVPPRRSSSGQCWCQGLTRQGIRSHHFYSGNYGWKYACP